MNIGGIFGFEWPPPNSSFFRLFSFGVYFGMGMVGSVRLFFFLSTLSSLGGPDACNYLSPF